MVRARQMERLGADAVAWERWSPAAGSGIFGMGRIGRELARMAAGFGMPVHYRDQVAAAAGAGARARPTMPTTTASSPSATCCRCTRRAGRGRGIGWMPSGSRKLPRGAIVANAARGTLIDDAALIAALRSGQVAAAGLDVYNGEPRVDPGYFELENVVLLPHLGSATAETRDAMGHLVLDGIDAVLAGTPACESGQRRIGPFWLTIDELCSPSSFAVPPRAPPGGAARPGGSCRRSSSAARRTRAAGCACRAPGARAVGEDARRRRRVGRVPSAKATNALGSAVRIGSGEGTTAASATAACSISTLSSSNGLIR